jgi:hypothetical protein
VVTVGGQASPPAYLYSYDGIFLPVTGKKTKTKTKTKRKNQSQKTKTKTKTKTKIK